jgi:RND family efflux transporter MFP subunit
MNDFDIYDRDDPTVHDRGDDSAVDTAIQKPPALRQQAAPRLSGGRVFALGGILLLAGGLSLGAWGRYSQWQQAQATAAQRRDFIPSVHVATVEANPSSVSVTLPGTTAAFAAANIYARATGYIAKRSVDIGDHVKAGDLLAQLAVPELDDQIAQAEANLKLAQATWDRNEALVREGVVSHQQGDVIFQNLKVQESLVKQLRQYRDYASVTAPFGGVITQRNVDVGSLVQGNATSGTFMFEIMREDIIRVSAYVPQDAAVGVAPGIDAVVRVPELPDRPFRGTVTRIADALQPGTRTLLTEVDIPNPDGALTPGIYCTVEFHVPRKTPGLSVPADALIFNGDGLQVAVVSHGKAEIRKVTETRDLGTAVEVNGGVSAGDQVILNPPVNLVDGSKVQPVLETVAAGQ